jgi:hypothetical protein
MPRVSSLMVRGSFVYLLLGFTLGALIMLQKGGYAPSGAWRLLPAHIELLLVGWTAQLAMGVAFWILPRYAPPEPRMPAVNPRGDERLAWLSFVLLNVGVLLTAFGVPAGLHEAVRIVGRASVALAIGTFVVNAWGRVKPIGR